MAVGDAREVDAADAHDVQMNVDVFLHAPVYDSGAVGEDIADAVDDGDEAYYVWSCWCGC